MSYLVLARKFRPQTFASIIGQEHISTALANAIIRDRVPHALLFTGPRGVGKTTTARVLAKALNCGGREIPKDSASIEAVEPCGQCSNCQEIAKSSSMAVWEIDGASNNSVDNVRELIESLYALPPPGSNYKIYIIDEVHMLSVAAFNALLKSLEEPPPNTIFVFATTEPQKIPDTVISRCQRHDFRRVAHGDIVDSLKAIAASEELEVEEAVFDFIASRARGGMRDAQSLFDRVIGFSTGGRIELALAQRIFGVLDRSFFFDLSEAVLRQDTEKVFSLVDQAFLQSIDLRSFFTDLITHWRNLMVFALGSKHGFSEADCQRFAVQTELATAFDFQRLFEIIESTVESGLKSNYPRFVLEAGLCKMASLPSLRPLAEIISAIETGEIPQERRPAERPRSNVEQGVDGELEEAPAVFNPSWEAFVNHVKSRGELVLAAHLRRVSALGFKLGTLKLQGEGFDIQALGKPDARENLEQCLFSYSGHDGWAIELSEAAETKDSLVSQEEEKKKAMFKQVEREAREDPLVKQALTTFEGSQVEKVSILKG